MPQGQEYLLNAISQALPPGAPQFFEAAQDAAERPDGGARALRRPDLWAPWYAPYGEAASPTNVRALPARSPDGGVLAWDACRSSADVFTVLCGEPGQPRGTPAAVSVEVRGARCAQDSFAVELRGLRPGGTYECAVAASSIRGNSTVSAPAYVVAGFTPSGGEGAGRVWSHRGEGGDSSYFGKATRSPATAQEAATGELLEQSFTALGSLCPLLPDGAQSPPQNLQVKRGPTANTLQLSWFYCTDLAEAFEIECRPLGEGVRGADGSARVPPARQTLGALCWQPELEFLLPLPPLAPESAEAAWGCEVTARGPRGQSAPARTTSADAGLFDASVFSEAGVTYCDFERARAEAALGDWEVPMGTEGITEILLPSGPSAPTGGGLLRQPAVGLEGFSGDSRAEDLPPAIGVTRIVDLGGPGGGLPPAAGPGGCSDEPPPGSRHSCEDQARWGKCGADFLRGWCRRACGRC